MRRFYFRLALGLGMTVSELLSRISSSELSEWLAYYSVEPFGSTNDEYLAALISSTVANTVRDEKRKSDPFSPTDFMRKEESQPDLMEKAIAIFKGLKNGTGKRNPKKSSSKDNS